MLFQLRGTSKYSSKKSFITSTTAGHTLSHAYKDYLYYRWCSSSLLSAEAKKEDKYLHIPFFHQLQNNFILNSNNQGSIPLNVISLIYGQLNYIFPIFVDIVAQDLDIFAQDLGWRLPTDQLPMWRHKKVFLRKTRFWLVFFILSKDNTMD